MKAILFTVIAAAFLYIVSLSLISCASKTPDVRLIDGKLRACPATPNCVSSESTDPSSRIEPFAFKGPPGKAWIALKEAIKQAGGKIEREDASYIWATFTSRIFRFVDDVEFRLEADAAVIHVRSGSRVGHSDLGVNRKRVERLRTLFQTGNHS